MWAFLQETQLLFFINIFRTAAKNTIVIQKKFVQILVLYHIDSDLIRSTRHSLSYQAKLRVDLIKSKRQKTGLN